MPRRFSLCKLRTPRSRYYTSYVLHSADVRSRWFRFREHVNARRLAVYALPALALALLAVVFCRPLLNAQPADLQCRDLGVIFMRGSSQNQDGKELENPLGDEFQKLEPESAAFFRAIDARIEGISKEYVSIHDFENRYDPKGYRAVSIFDSSIYYKNMFEAEWSAAGAFGGEYRQSVAGGIGELTGYLQEKVHECPDERFVLAGYSQGADVVGSSLAYLGSGAPDVLTHITSVSLIADPKYNARGKAGELPWVRGTAPLGSYGALEARTPYVPDLLRAKTSSFCEAADPVCNDPLPHVMVTCKLDPTCVAPVIQGVVNGQQHAAYLDRYIPEAAKEVAARAKNDVAALGGSTKSVTAFSVAGTDKQKMDVMIVFDTTASMGGILSAVKENIRSILDDYKNAGLDLRAGLVEFRDSSSSSPDYVGGADFAARTNLDLTDDLDEVKSAINRLSLGDGGDLPEMQLSGIMEAYKQEWRAGAQKKLIVLTDSYGKNPEPTTGYTHEMVVERALHLKETSVSFMHSEGYTNDDWYYNLIAPPTGGKQYDVSMNPTPEQVSEVFREILDQPVADVAGPEAGHTDEPIDFNAGESFDPDGTITEIAWDFNGDGQWDVVGPETSVEWTYEEPYDGPILIEVRTADGGTARAELHMVVQPAEVPADPAPLAPPLNLVAVRTESDLSTLAVNWDLPPEPVDFYYELTNAAGDIVGLANPLWGGVELHAIPDDEFVLYITAVRGGDLSEAAEIVVPAKPPTEEPAGNTDSETPSDPDSQTDPEANPEPAQPDPEPKPNSEPEPTPGPETDPEAPANPEATGPTPEVVVDPSPAPAPEVVVETPTPTGEVSVEPVPSPYPQLPVDTTPSVSTPTTSTQPATNPQTANPPSGSTLGEQTSNPQPSPTVQDPHPTAAEPAPDSAGPNTSNTQTGSTIQPPAPETVVWQPVSQIVQPPAATQPVLQAADTSALQSPLSSKTLPVLNTSSAPLPSARRTAALLPDALATPRYRASKGSELLASTSAASTAKAQPIPNVSPSLPDRLRKLDTATARRIWLLFAVLVVFFGLTLTLLRRSRRLATHS